MHCHVRSLLVAAVVVLASVLAQRFNITSRVRVQKWPNLKAALEIVDRLANRTGHGIVDGSLGNRTGSVGNRNGTGFDEGLSSINEQLDSLLSKVQCFKRLRLRVGDQRTKDLVRAINTCDSAERECLLKILGIPGLSKYYYDIVLNQLARQIGVKFHESDLVMLKRMNAQPNFVDQPEVAYSNLSYPIFIKFGSESAKFAFLSRLESVAFEKSDPHYLDKVFGTNLEVDKMEGATQKIQIHGFQTMTTRSLYSLLDRLCRAIQYSTWKENIITLYQTRYTKHFDSAGEEQLQTEGIIIKLKSRALKYEWMKKTREAMLRRPKMDRKKGFIVHLEHHIKYRHRNFTVFIDEHLSTHKKNLFLIARGRCMLLKWLHCWTWDGNVFVRKAFNSTTHRIDTFEAIDSIIK